MTHVDLLKLLMPSSMDVQGESLSAELMAEGNALDAAQFNADQILLEASASTAVLTLADWERVYGLPESCVIAAGITQSIAERRAALVAKVNMHGGQSKAFFISLAAQLGYVITIDELRPHTTEFDTESAVTDEQWQFIFQVNAPLATVLELTTEDDTEMATAVWGNQLLECTINRYKPAHIYALFSYT